MSAKPMLRRRGSIAVLMNSLSSGSSSSSSVCGLGTLTNAMSSSFARSREMRASSNVLISASFISAPPRFSSRRLGAAAAERLLHARPDHQHDADREDRRRQRPQEEHRIIVVGDHQRLVERAFGELAENEADDQADQWIAVPAREMYEQAEQEHEEHVR